MFFLMQQENNNFKADIFQKKTVASTPSPSDFDGLRWYPIFFMKMTTKDVKEITYLRIMQYL